MFFLCHRLTVYIISAADDNRCQLRPISPVVLQPYQYAHAGTWPSAQWLGRFEMMTSARPRESRLLERLTFLCVAVGVFSTLSYALSAPIALRFTHPSLGAWWDAYEFYFMAGAAACILRRARSKASTGRWSAWPR